MCSVDQATLTVSSNKVKYLVPSIFIPDSEIALQLVNVMNWIRTWMF